MSKIRVFLEVVYSIILLTLVLLAFLPVIGYIFLRVKWMRWRALRAARAELRKAGFSQEEIEELEKVAVPSPPKLGGVLRWLTSKK
ncbi:MAG: hypothetical protein DRN90_03035 [Thermoproteota archaeon]|nr:MAG: hypothetical protein DRN90_03035 [Candidatus Korarchaeota archaeon]